MSVSVKALFLVALGFSIVPAGATEIVVTLFGSKCKLRGNFEKPALQAVHAVSPAEALPSMDNEDERNPSDLLRKIRQSLSKTKAPEQHSLPKALHYYREQLIRRLTAQSAFLEAWMKYEKDSALPAFSKSLAPYLEAEKLKELEAQLKKNGAAKKPAKGEMKVDTFTQVFKFYNGWIVSSPEADFHRVIRTAGVEYLCAFDDGEEDDHHE